MESKKWYRWTYLQGRNRDTDVENGLVETAEEQKGGTNWESSIDKYTLRCIKQRASRKIPWMEELDRLQYMGSRRIRHDWATSLSLFTFMHWRRKWQPTPVFLPGESQGRRSLVGCRLWGRTELDTTEVTLQYHVLISCLFFFKT